MALGHQLNPKPRAGHSTPNSYLLWWCGTCQNNPKREGKPTRTIQKREGKSLTWCPFFPLFGAVLEALKGHFSKVKNGSPGIIIAEGGWFFSLPSSYSRHFHKNVNRNTNCDRKWWGRQNKSWRGQESCHGYRNYRHLRAATTVAQYSSGPCSSSTWN